MDIRQKDKEYIAGTYRRFEPVFVKGVGATLFDDGGKSYVDFASGIGVNVLGHSNKRWIEAVEAQLSSLAHVSNLYYSEPCARLAEILCERSGMKKVFFCNSGTEANECAIKAARKYAFDKKKTTKPQIIVLENGFHGRTLASLSATAQKQLQKPCFAPYAEGFRAVKGNDIEALTACVCADTAAVMLELIQGEGGVIALDLNYVRELAQICRSRDILLIVDEVQTGNGRTGALYAYMKYGIKPDIVTTAKGLGNGLPIGAVMFGEKTENTLGFGDHGSTFGGNPAICAGAIEVLDQLDEKLLAEVDKKRAIIVSAVENLAGVKSVSGLGLMIGIETDSASQKAAECLCQGLVVLTAHDKLRLLPPLNIGREELEKGIEILKEVLK